MKNTKPFEPNDKYHEEMHAQIKKIHSTNCDYVNADVLHQYIDDIYLAAQTNHIPDTGNMVSDSIIEVLRQAIMVVAYRAGDVSTEDGCYATTDTDSIIHLERALCEALGTRYDDLNLKEAIELLCNLQTLPRITEKDALAICQSFADHTDAFAPHEEAEIFIKSDAGRKLLKSLNGDHIAEAGGAQ